MAIYRKIHTSFWSDSFVSDLEQDQKLFYIYLLTNERTKQCGVYEITKKQIAYDLGYSMDRVSILLVYFIKRGKIKYNEVTKEMAIGNWLKYNNSSSSTVQSCINKEFTLVKDRVLIEYVRSMDTHSQEEEEEEEEEEQTQEKNNIEERKLKFASTLKNYIGLYGKDFLNDFYRYWTEPNKTKTKFRQELEKTWDLERRLETWAKNEKNFNKNGKSKAEQRIDIIANYWSIVSRLEKAEAGPLISIASDDELKNALKFVYILCGFGSDKIPQHEVEKQILHEFIRGGYSRNTTEEIKLCYILALKRVFKTNLELYDKSFSAFSFAQTFGDYITWKKEIKKNKELNIPKHENKPAHPEIASAYIEKIKKELIEKSKVEPVSEPERNKLHGEDEQRKLFNQIISEFDEIYSKQELPGAIRKIKVEGKIYTQEMYLYKKLNR